MKSNENSITIPKWMRWTIFSYKMLLIFILLVFLLSTFFPISEWKISPQVNVENQRIASIDVYDITYGYSLEINTNLTLVTINIGVETFNPTLFSYHYKNYVVNLKALYVSDFTDMQYYVGNSLPTVGEVIIPPGWTTTYYTITMNFFSFGQTPLPTSKMPDGTYYFWLQQTNAITPLLPNTSPPETSETCRVVVVGGGITEIYYSQKLGSWYQTPWNFVALGLFSVGIIWALPYFFKKSKEMSSVNFVFYESKDKSSKNHNT